MVESQADQPLDHSHRGGVPVDRRRRHAVRLHRQGGAAYGVPPPRSVVTARRGPARAGCRSTAAGHADVAPPAGRRCDRPGGDRAAHPGFLESPYATKWLELLRSERLRELAERAGLSIAFVPHPNSADFLTATSPRPRRGLPVPRRRHPGTLCPWCGDDHRLLVERVRARLPEPAVIYFQFDPEDFYSGQHVYRRGEWNYETDGFGPVAERRPRFSTSCTARRPRDEARRAVRRANGAGVRVPRRGSLRAGVRVDPRCDARPTSASRGAAGRLTGLERPACAPSTTRRLPVVDVACAVRARRRPQRAAMEDGERPARMERAGHAVAPDRHRAIARGAAGRRAAAG